MVKSYFQFANVCKIKKIFFSFEQTWKSEIKVTFLRIGMLTFDLGIARANVKRLKVKVTFGLENIFFSLA